MVMQRRPAAAAPAAHLLAQLHTHLISNAPRNSDRCHTARLRAPDQAALSCKPRLQQQLRDLRRLAAACLAHHDECVVCACLCYQSVACTPHGQALTLHCQPLTPAGVQLPLIMCMCEGAA
jgi:hypothetical protein